MREQPPALKELITFDATAFGGSTVVENNLNTLLRFGTNASQVAAATGDGAQAVAAADPNTNPHLKFADCNAQRDDSSHPDAYALADSYGHARSEYLFGSGGTGRVQWRLG